MAKTNDREDLELLLLGTLRRAQILRDAPGSHDAVERLTKELTDELLSRMPSVTTPERVWVQPDPRHGYVNIKRGDVILARTKSLNVARSIRDALNAPDTLMGQTVEVDESQYHEHHDGTREPIQVRVHRGVVMALADVGGAPGLVLRLADNRLEAFALTSATIRIVEPDAPEPVTWEP